MAGAKLYRAVVLSTAILFSSAAQAMPVPQFDKMDKGDQGTYVTLLVIGAKNALEAHGSPDQANKLVALFKDSGPNNGFVQFVNNLQKIRTLNARNAEDPNNKQAPFEVEHAFYLTLKDNGITVPVSVLLAINKDFKPGQSTGGKSAPK